MYFLKFQPVINLPERSEKAIVFSPEKMDENAKNIVLNAIENLTGLTTKFDSYSVSLNYNDWPVKSCIAAILPKGLEFGYAGYLVIANLMKFCITLKSFS